MNTFSSFKCQRILIFYNEMIINLNNTKNKKQKNREKELNTCAGYVLPDVVNEPGPDIIIPLETASKTPYSFLCSYSNKNRNMPALTFFTNSAAEWGSAKIFLLKHSFFVVRLHMK